MKPAVLGGLVAGVAIPVFGVYLRYRRDMNAARAHQALVERHVVSTEWGAVEYAEQGHGEPVLVVHGIFHNCVGALLSVRDLVPNRRVIAPSRFCYGSSMPPHATPAAQADAFAALLDTLSRAGDARATAIDSARRSCPGIRRDRAPRGSPHLHLRQNAWSRTRARRHPLRRADETRSVMP